MGRLIDADELKKCAIPCEIHNGALTDLCVPLYQINNAPTVEERPQGKWIYEKADYDRTDGYICSICGCSYHTKVPYFAEFNFCPNCGAQMTDEVKI